MPRKMITRENYIIFMSLIALWALLGSFSSVHWYFVNSQTPNLYIFCSVWLNQVDVRIFFDGFIGFRGRSFRIWQKEKNRITRSKSTKILEFKKSQLGDSSTDFENFFTKQFLLTERTTYPKTRSVPQRFRVPIFFCGNPTYRRAEIFWKIKSGFQFQDKKFSATKNSKNEF